MSSKGQEHKAHLARYFKSTGMTGCPCTKPPVEKGSSTLYVLVVPSGPIRNKGNLHNSLGHERCWCTAPWMQERAQHAAHPPGVLRPLVDEAGDPPLVAVLEVLVVRVPPLHQQELHGLGQQAYNRDVSHSALQAHLAVSQAIPW